MNLRLPGWEQTSKVNHYQFNDNDVVRQVKCRQSNGGSPCKPRKEISQLAHVVKVVSWFIKQSV